MLTFFFQTFPTFTNFHDFPPKAMSPLHCSKCNNKFNFKNEGKKLHGKLLLNLFT